MTQTAQLFTSSVKMLVRDKTAFMMALIFPVVFVLAFAVFDVSFDAEGAIAGVDYFEYVLPALLAIGLMNFAMVGTAASVTRYRELKILKRIVVTPLRRYNGRNTQIISTSDGNTPRSQFETTIPASRA